MTHLPASVPTVFCTGHRDLSSPTAKWVRYELARIAVKLRDEHGTTTAVSGMALQSDQHWAWAALAAGLDLWAFLPFPQQADPWNTTQRADWGVLRRHAVREVIVGDLGDLTGLARKTRASQLLYARNAEMVAVSHACVAVWDGRRRGGTYGAILKARDRMPLIWVDVTRRLVVDGIAAHHLVAS